MYPPVSKFHHKDNIRALKAANVFLSFATVGLFIITLSLLAIGQKSSAMVDYSSSRALSSYFASDDANVCNGTKLAFDNQLCADLEVPVPQAGGNVTKGYVGELEVDVIPNTMPFYQSAMCPVNVHWHLGSEHYSYGQFDENGDGPHGNVPRPEWAERNLEGNESEETQAGFRCHHYNPSDRKFTAEYKWKHCRGMEVGETYEVHWPHSAAGACGTVNQYQTPHYDGLFCHLDMDTFSTLAAQDVVNAIGVHAQVFTVVNDETYFYPDMMRGMIVDEEMDIGQDVAFYTGSTTGVTRSNEVCSMYAPITWQVDRKCHLISASSFDKLCYEMKMQRDDMSNDLHAHGSRELVSDDLVANNQARKTLRRA